jgi:DNA-binding NarL/FixJ family response regulator
VAAYIFGLLRNPLLVYQYMGDGQQREPVRILIADDHEVIRRSVIRVLESRDDSDECAEATNGREAVEKALEWKPDLVLLDIRLPGLSGFEVSRLIRQQQPDIPILFFSIYDTDDILKEARLAGDGFILKEKIVEMLPDAIKALLQKQTFFPSNNSMEPSN